MLKKEFRVTKEREFQRIYKKGLFLQGQFLKVNLLDNRLSFTRIAVVVSKKVEKSAVKRNKAKRVVRGSIEDLFSDIKVGLDIVINVKKNALGKKIKDIDGDLRSILAKLKAI